jgi:hypothetical protein
MCAEFQLFISKRDSVSPFSDPTTRNPSNLRAADSSSRKSPYANSQSESQNLIWSVSLSSFPMRRQGSHYQLCNRFAWAWKLASMGIPTILVYLAFLQCTEMCNRGTPFSSPEDWEQSLKEHYDGIVPPNAWGVRIPTTSAPMWAFIRSLEAQWKVF